MNPTDRLGYRTRLKLTAILNSGLAGYSSEKTALREIAHILDIEIWPPPKPKTEKPQ